MRIPDTPKRFYVKMWPKQDSSTTINRRAKHWRMQIVEEQQSRFQSGLIYIYIKTN